MTLGGMKTWVTTNSEGTAVEETVLYAFNGCIRWAIVLTLFTQPSSLESTPGHCLSSSKGLNDPSSGSPPKFPMTPAEFHLFPSARSTGDTRRSQNAEIEKEGCLGVSHLTTLRSAAFWELRRSVIENGEGLIRRMRDYELSRLHQQVCQKANERKRRGHKSSTLRPRCKARPHASDNDDVRMRSEDTSKGSSSWSPLSTSLDLMDVDDEYQYHLGRKGPRSIPGDSYSQVQLPYDEGMLFTCNSRKAEEDSDSPLTYPESASPTPSSSSISLPLPQSLSMTTDRLLVSPTTSSEKALAELNFAFANGACGITDYSPIWSYQKKLNTDEHDNIRQGDLWR